MAEEGGLGEKGFSAALRMIIHDGRITVIFRQGCYQVLVAADLLDTWELSTAVVFIQIALSRLNQTNTRTLTT